MIEVGMPFIRPEDYEAFRAILQDELPGTYQEWRDLMLVRGHQVLRNGELPVPQEVNPREFVAWLPTRWDQQTLNGLFAFAAFRAQNTK